MNKSVVLKARAQDINFSFPVNSPRVGNPFSSLLLEIGARKWYRVKYSMARIEYKIITAGRNK
jgi:hypothetical protein